MKNVAEFTIIGRVGARKTLGKAVRVTIASNYRLKDERGDWREDTPLERGHGVQPHHAGLHPESMSPRATWSMCAGACGRAATSATAAGSTRSIWSPAGSAAWLRARIG